MDASSLSGLLAIPELPNHISKVDKTLKDLIGQASPHISEPALRMLGTGGKHLRSILLIASASCEGFEIDQNVINSCTAIELVHLSSIIHDDIIDNADTRRGVPTIHTKEGLGAAIVIGDYLLGLSAKQASTWNVSVSQIVAKATTDLCDGEGLELVDSYNKDRTVESYLQTVRLKTAALTLAACQVGATCSRAQKTDEEALKVYGEAFGMSFQIMDDILDILSTPEAMGKPVGNDMKEGNFTLPVLLALQTPSKDKIETWLTKDAEPDKSDVINTLIDCGAIQKSLDMVKHYNQHAADSLKALDKSGNTAGLCQLPNAYYNWAMTKQKYL